MTDQTESSTDNTETTDIPTENKVKVAEDKIINEPNRESSVKLPDNAIIGKTENVLAGKEEKDSIKSDTVTENAKNTLSSSNVALGTPKSSIPDSVELQDSKTGADADKCKKFKHYVVA